MQWFESFIAKEFRPSLISVMPRKMRPGKGGNHLNVMPYCETDSNPDFQTSVTSQAFVAWSLHERNADTELPPTVAPKSVLRVCRWTRNRGVALRPHEAQQQAWR